MATDTQAVSIPATCTHTRPMSTREHRLRVLEELLMRRIRSLEWTYAQAVTLEARFGRVFDEICELTIARSCDCERWT